MSVSRTRSSSSEADELVYETCRDRIIPLFPVISVSESLLADKASDDHVAKYASVDRHPPTPLPHIVRMIHCAIAAASRDLPADIRSNVWASLHRLLTGPEMTKIAATRCLGTVQVLILLSMCDDLNGPSAVGASEAVWQNVGSAIRMGFGIVSVLSCSVLTDRAYIAISRLLRYHTFSSIVACEFGEHVSPWTDGKPEIEARLTI